MIPSPHLRQNTLMLHLPIESPEETIEALSIRKHYICHMIPPFPWSIYLTYVSYLRPMCQGNVGEITDFWWRRLVSGTCLKLAYETYCKLPLASIWYRIS